MSIWLSIPKRNWNWTYKTEIYWNAHIWVFVWTHWLSSNSGFKSYAVCLPQPVQVTGWPLEHVGVAGLCIWWVKGEAPVLWLWQYVDLNYWTIPSRADGKKICRYNPQEKTKSIQCFEKHTAWFCLVFLISLVAFPSKYWYNIYLNHLGRRL